MTSKRELVNRWSREPGKTFLQNINAFCFELQMPGHGRRSSDLFAMLEGLPFREEVPNGRDLRGAMLSGGVHELDFRECDFSFARLEMNFVNCDFTGARFDEVTAGGHIILKTLNRASFRKAKLRGCFFQRAEALGCTFDQAVLVGASFEGANLAASSFRETDCKRANFLRANLVGCDFQKAKLDEAVFQEVRLDKSTNLRGASLVNTYLNERRDRAGNLVARGTDWRQATYDASTSVGSDPAVMALEILNSASALLKARNDPQAVRLRQALETTKAQVSRKYQADWYDDVLAKVHPEDVPFVEQVLTEAMERLL